MIKPTSMIKSLKYHDQKVLFVTLPRSRSTSSGAPCPLSPGHPHAVNWRKKFCFFSFWSCFWSWYQWPGHFLSRQSSISFFSPKQDASTDSLVDLFIGSSIVWNSTVSILMAVKSYCFERNPYEILWTSYRSPKGLARGALVTRRHRRRLGNME